MAERLPADVREPAVAGVFYPADRQVCRAQAQAFLHPQEPAQAPRQPVGGAAERVPWIGALVPHAGWICSGAIAGQAIAALAQERPQVDVVVLFGAVHTRGQIDWAALDTHARWQVPGGDVTVAEELQRKLLELSPELFRVDARFHADEHAVEVELPLIQLAWPQARVLPIEVPLSDQAVQIGRQTALAVASLGLEAVYLASSDLTHYGPAYGFSPAGVGSQGLEWAQQNDQRLLDRVLKLDAEQIVPEVRSHWNACGGGAVAAMVAACRQSGASRAAVLRHANSCQTLADVAPQPPDNAVGYAAVVIG